MSLLEEQFPALAKRLAQMEEEQGLPKDALSNRLEQRLAYKMSPGGQSEVVEAEQIRMAQESARRTENLAREQEWVEHHAFKWLLEPCPIFDEDIESTVWQVIANPEEVQAIRTCAKDWELGSRANGRLDRHLFDHLAHLDLDFESIVRRELGLRMEALDGIPFRHKNEPLGSY